MKRKVYVAYKVDETNVAPLEGAPGQTTVKDYADYTAKKLMKCRHAIEEVYQCADDTSDLTGRDWVSIWEQVKDPMYDTQASVIFITPEMKNDKLADAAQWIPWYMYFSVHKMTREDYNPVVLVVLPDAKGSTAYFDQDKTFEILKKNIENDYVYLTDWSMFSRYPDMCIDVAAERKAAVDFYKVYAAV